MEKITRERRSAAQWSELVSQWRASGETARAFCERRGLKTSTFSWWQRELRQRGLGGVALKVPRPRLPLRDSGVASGFARIEVRQPSPAPSSRLEVVSRSGHVVRVQGAVDAAALHALLEALESC